MSDLEIYKEIFDTHQKFFETYIKKLKPEKEAIKFSNCRLSYINYLTDVNYIIYKYS